VVAQHVAVLVHGDYGAAQGVVRHHVAGHIGGKTRLELEHVEGVEQRAGQSVDLVADLGEVQVVVEIVANQGAVHGPLAVTDQGGYRHVLYREQDRLVHLLANSARVHDQRCDGIIVREDRKRLEIDDLGHLVIFLYGSGQLDLVAERCRRRVRVDEDRLPRRGPLVHDEAVVVNGGDHTGSGDQLAHQGRVARRVGGVLDVVDRDGGRAGNDKNRQGEGEQSLAHGFPSFF